MNPAIVVDQIRSGERTGYTSSEPHDLLLICEQALGQGVTEIAEIFYPELNSIEQSIYQFRMAQLGNDAELAQTHLTTALQNSRTRELRDHLLSLIHI